MQFSVVPAVAPDPTTPLEFLQLPAITPLPPETVTRPLALLEEMSAFLRMRRGGLLGTVASTAAAPGLDKRLWMDPSLRIRQWRHGGLGNLQRHS